MRGKEGCPGISRTLNFAAFLLVAANTALNVVNGVTTNVNNNNNNNRSNNNNNNNNQANSENIDATNRRRKSF